MRIEGGSWTYGPRTIKKLMEHFNKAHNISKGILSLVMILTYFLVSVCICSFPIPQYLILVPFTTIHGFVPIFVKFKNKNG